MQLHVVSGDEAVFPIHQNRVRQFGLAAQLHLRRLGQFGNTGFAHHFALNVVAVLAVHKHFHIDARALGGFEQYHLRVPQVRQRFAGFAREDHLHRHIIVVEQPAQHVQFVDQGVGDGHVGCVVLTHPRVAVSAVKHQRFADLPAVDDGLERLITGVVRAHEADLHQPVAMGNFRVDDVAATGSRDRQRLFAKHRLAGADGRQHILFVARPPGRDQHGLDISRLNQRVRVRVHLGT